MRVKSREIWDKAANKLSKMLLDNYLIVSADTPELKDICYHLRYHVYCVENQFEDPTDNVNGLETDEYDEFSAHALVVHRPTGMAVGTVRLILPTANLAPPLPFLTATASAGNEAYLNLSLAQTAEISRFAISKAHRRRLAKHMRSGPAAEDATSADNLQITGGAADLITLALVRAFFQLAAKNEVLRVCALMEKSLLRRAEKLGLHFEIVGPTVAYHGWREPTSTSILGLLERAKLERYDVWHVISGGGELEPKFAKLLAAE